MVYVHIILFKTFLNSIIMRFYKTVTSVRRPLLNSPKGGRLERFYCIFWESKRKFLNSYHFDLLLLAPSPQVRRCALTKNRIFIKKCENAIFPKVKISNLYYRYGLIFLNINFHIWNFEKNRFECGLFNCPCGATRTYYCYL